MKLIRTCVLLAITLPGLISLHAQTNGSNSPYSRYGFGLLSDGGQGFNKGMGGLGYALTSPRYINYKNPATYADVDSLTMLVDAGFTLQNGNIGRSGNRTNAHNTSFDYLMGSFRLHKNIGVAFGLRPYSTVGYSFSTQTPITLQTGELTQTEAYNGDGGLHEVMLGIGFRPFRQLAIGVNGGYLWGDLTHTVNTSFGTSTINSLKRTYSADISTYRVEAGLQFSQRITKKDRVTLGLVYGLGHNVASTAHHYDQRLQSSTVVTADTARIRNAFALPHTFGAGLVWQHKEKLRIGADYTFTQWDDVKFPYLEGSAYVSRKGQLRNSHKVVLGADFVPNPDGTHWRDHIVYRAGASYTSSYVRLNGQSGPQSYAVSAGVGLPLIRTWSNFPFTSFRNCCMLNISAGYERIQPRTSGHLTEHYLRLTIGLSFAEQWFKKWKVE